MFSLQHPQINRVMHSRWKDHHHREWVLREISLSPGGMMRRMCPYLQVELVHMPGLWQRSTKPEHVSHSIPGQECWAREELLNLWLVQTKSSVNLKKQIYQSPINQPINDRQTDTSCHRASWPVKASGRLIPFSAIQSISLSHLDQSHQTEE